MTGYGRGEAITQGKKIVAELRAVNSKQLDLSIKIPGIYRSCEAPLRAQVMPHLQRGKVDLLISYEVIEERAASSRINAGLFADYYNQLKAAASNAGVNWSGEAVESAAVAVRG